MAEEIEQAARAKKAKRESLEKQLKLWSARQKELRSVSCKALDSAFVRRQLDRCGEEIKKIQDALSRI